MSLAIEWSAPNRTRFASMALLAAQWVQVVPPASMAPSKSGTYRNPSYGYVVHLPRQFHYELALAPQPDRGFRAQLPFYASVWIAAIRTDSASLAGVMAFVRAGHRRCREVSSVPTRLSHLSATEVTYSCPGANNLVRTNRLVVAVRRDSHLGMLQYGIGLESPTPVDKRAWQAFETIRNGFRTSSTH